mmetsp:Transcript_27455/g.64672  ORF Transcript_27455/g.64672 Transcript_27455/m.64672 type:complete len:479 (+) Transcript_27455:70-1506(+)
MLNALRMGRVGLAAKVAVVCCYLILEGLAGETPPTAEAEQQAVTCASASGCTEELWGDWLARELADLSSDQSAEFGAEAALNMLQVHRSRSAARGHSLKWTSLKARTDKGEDGLQGRRLKPCPFLKESVLVTGGTQGIGFQTALAFIELGASKVHIIGRCKSKGEAARRSLVAFARAKMDSPCRSGNTNNGDLVQFHALDVGETSGNTSAMSQLLAKPAFRRSMCANPLKYAVNSAGIGGATGPTYTLTPALLQNTYNGNAYHTNLLGNLWSMSAEWAYFRDVAKECGIADFSIVALSSLEGIRACPGCAVYGSTKFGINGLVQSIALEARSDNIVEMERGESVAMKLRVNSVLPGLVSTPLTWNQARQTIGLKAYQCCSGNYRDANVDACGKALKAGRANVVTGTLLCADRRECMCPNVASNDPAITEAFPPKVLKTMLDPEEVAAAIVSLSDNGRSSGITATEVTVDNGDHAGIPA